jgi:hypothetical protein
MGSIRSELMIYILPGTREGMIEIILIHWVSHINYTENLVNDEYVRRNHQTSGRERMDIIGYT